MGGGDLNMKKSWHPLLHVNQERVWRREKEALEERKKLEELRRERDQEREIQVLQRLQEEAGGKKRADRVEWLYATPATQGGASATELEDYLLGKKRVDKLLKGDEAQKVSKHDQSSFISLQSANAAQDVAAKIREDPMLLIKQQEQAAYETLLRDPTRLRQMKIKAGIQDSSESKEERRRRKEEKRKRKQEEKDRPRDHRSRDRSPSRERHSSRSEQQRGRASDDYYRPRDHHSSRDSHRDRDERLPRNERDRRDQQDSSQRYPKPRIDERDQRDRNQRASRQRSRSSSPLNHNAQRRRPYENSRRHDQTTDFQRDLEHRNDGDHRDADKEAERRAKLEEMMSNAKSLEASRHDFVTRINAQDAAQETKEAELREKALKSKQKGLSDGKGQFLLDQQRKVFGDDVDLAERLRRGRGGLQKLD